MHRDGFFCVLGLRIVVQAVAALRQVQNFVVDSPSSLLWDFGSLYQRRCGVVSDALSRQPSNSSTSLRRLWLGVAAQACGTSLSDISAFPRRCGVAYHTQKSDCDINASYTQGSVCDINASHTQGCVCVINVSLTISRHLHITGFPRSDRGHHVPALTVTSGERGVGFDMLAWGRLVVLRRQVVFVALASQCSIDISVRG